MDNNDDWDSEMTLQLSLHDYLVKKKCHKTAAIFREEVLNVPNNIDVENMFPATEYPGGVLKEWWNLHGGPVFSRRKKHEQDGNVAGAGNAMLSQQVASTSMFDLQPQITGANVTGQVASTFPAASMFDSQQQTTGVKATGAGNAMISQQVASTFPAVEENASIESPEGLPKEWWSLYMDEFFSEQNELAQDGNVAGAGNAMLSQQVASTNMFDLQPQITGAGNAMLSQQVASTFPAASMFDSQQQTTGAKATGAGNAMISQEVAAASMFGSQQQTTGAKVTGANNAMLSQQVATFPTRMFDLQQQIMPPYGNITPHHEKIDANKLSPSMQSSSSSRDQQQQFCRQDQQIILGDNRNTTSFGGHWNSSVYGVSSISPGLSGSNLTPGEGGEFYVNSQENMTSKALPQLSGNQLTNLPATSDKRSSKGQRSSSGNK